MTDRESFSYRIEAELAERADLPPYARAIARLLADELDALTENGVAHPTVTVAQLSGWSGYAHSTVRFALEELATGPTPTCLPAGCVRLAPPRATRPPSRPALLALDEPRWFNGPPDPDPDPDLDPGPNTDPGPDDPPAVRLPAGDPRAGRRPC